MDPQAVFLTLGETARILVASQELVRRLGDSGTLRMIRVGPTGWRLFERRDVERLARERHVGAPHRKEP